MRYYFAPMEGVTGALFRQVHHRYFPGVDKYYTPFLSPSQDHVFSRRERREIEPGRNEGLNVVPQLLTRRAEDFLWAAEELFQRGYREVNLNLGCPSGTVTAKGKGAGFLGRRAELEEFLDTVFARAGGPISVKTRLGVQDPEEFWALLELYNRYPIVELTIHPRVQKDLYRHPVRREELGRMLVESRNPVCYNGDIVTQRDLEELEGTWKGFEAVMIGRGLIADPAMVSCRQGGPALDRERLGRFLEELYQGYTEEYGGARNAMFRMKELWPYLLCRFQGAEGYGKKLRKARTPGEYEDVARRILDECPLRPETEAGW